MSDPDFASGDDGTPSDQILAAEYALGLMGREARAVFEARLVIDSALRTEVALWSEHLAGLGSAVAPVQPPAPLRGQIERRLFGVDVKRGGLSLFRFLAGGVLAASLALAVLVLVPAQMTPELLAEITAADRSLRVAAAYDTETAILTLRREEGAAAAGRVHEVWLIAAGADAPISLGVLPDSGESRVQLPADLAGLLAGATLAISDEPPGGSPTGQPTGAVLATGAVQPA